MRKPHGSLGVSLSALAIAAVTLTVAAGTHAAQAPAAQGATPAAPAQAAPAAPPRPRYPPIDTSKMMLEDPAHQKADLPSWAYIPIADPAHPAPKRERPDPNEVLHVPGTDKTYKRSEIGDGYNVPDWFPNLHPNPVPDVVIHG